VELKRERTGAEDEQDHDEPRAAPASDVADLRFHLLKTRLRVAVESLEGAERLLRTRGAHLGAGQEDARALIENARRELESLKSLVRGDGGGVV
jgi:hypothetical protein